MKYGNKLTGLLFVIISIIMVFAMACAPAAAPPEEQKVLKLGCIMPFSGPAAMYGERGRQITDIYIELLDEDGGVKIGNDTYKVELHWGDGQFAPAPAAAAARKLIYDDRIVAIVGYIGPGFSALSPVTNPEKVILICRTGSAIYSPAKDPYVVFGSPTGEVTLNQALAAMQAHPDFHVLAWTGTSDDRRMTESVFKTVDDRLEKEFGIKGLRIYYPSGTTNFTPYLTKMKDEGAQMVFVGGTILEVALIAKQRWEMGYKCAIVHSSDNLIDILFNVAGKDAAQGIMGNRNNPMELKKVVVAQKYLDMTQRIVNRFQEKYGKPIDNYGVFSMSITHLSQYFECAQSIGSTDPDAMMKAFKGGTFDSFLGRYTFSGTKTYGAPVVFGYPCAMGEVKGDKEVYLGEYPLTDADMWYDYFNQE
ncbi:MAG: ABC transporter substrate-binding protein [Dehalococcoidia bacterium]|nr:ABC transporter substrate-binding protein [Dehalococcoidia bacterium]